MLAGGEREKVRNVHYKNIQQDECVAPRHKRIPSNSVCTKIQPSRRDGEGRGGGTIQLRCTQIQEHRKNHLPAPQKHA